MKPSSLFNWETILKAVIQTRVLLMAFYGIPGHMAGFHWDCFFFRSGSFGRYGHK
jgi:hypothetical protein